MSLCYVHGWLCAHVYLWWVDVRVCLLGIHAQVTLHHKTNLWINLFKSYVYIIPQIIKMHIME